MLSLFSCHYRFTANLLLTFDWHPVYSICYYNLLILIRTVCMYHMYVNQAHKINVSLYNQEKMLPKSMYTCQHVHPHLWETVTPCPHLTCPPSGQPHSDYNHFLDSPVLNYVRANYFQQWSVTQKRVMLRLPGAAQDTQHWKGAPRCRTVPVIRGQLAFMSMILVSKRLRFSPPLWRGCCI